MSEKPIPSSQDAQGAYRAFEHEGWEAAAARYEGAFAGATRPYVPHLLDAAGAAPGMTLLDLACGTGVCAGEAAARGIAAVGADFSPAMIDLARRLNPGIAFHVADAEALPFPDRSFDAVVINFGAHHFPDPAAALREARRVTRAGGRVAFTVWAKGVNAAFAIVFAAVSAHGEAAGRYPAPPGGDLVSEQDCLGLLARAGFAPECASARRVDAVWSLHRPEDLIDRFAAGTVRTAKLLASQAPARLAAIRTAAATAVSRFRNGATYDVPTAAILATGMATGHER